MSEAVVTATEANRSFAKMLRLVRDGTSVRITSHGETVAIMSPPPVDEEAARKRRLAAMAEMERHWATLTPSVIGPWTRDELYERDE